MPATLEQLTRTRSRLTEEVMDYLVRLAQEMEQTYWVRGGESIKVGDIAVEPFVMTKRGALSAEQRGREPGAPEPGAAERSLLDEVEAQRYELPRQPDDRVEFRWRQMLCRGHLRLVVKGAPGGGKTFMTRLMVAELARKEWARLNAQGADVEAVTAPIWVTAKALARARAAEIDEALREAVEDSTRSGLSPSVCHWLKRAVGSSRVLVVVDALDELVGDDRDRFVSKAKRLGDVKMNWPVVVTCRTMHWEGRKGWLPWGRLEEVELAPFRRRQQQEFTKRFFVPRPASGRGMERLLRVNYALRDACATPLILAFACLLHEEGVINESTSYAALYGHLFRKMVSGEWRGAGPHWTSSEVRAERYMHDVESIAHGIFMQAPQQNLFTLADWRRSAAAADVSSSLDPAALLEELEQVGLIVPAGFNEKIDRCWSFVHRTFLEFLTARTLSRQGQEECMGEAGNHLWFEPEWLEVLTFLAALADDATPLIQMCEGRSEGDDLFGSLLYLESRLIGAAVRVDEQVERGVCDEALSFWRGTLDERRHHLQQFALPMLASLARRATARLYLTRAILREARSPDATRRAEAAKALAGMGTEEAIARLLTLTKDRVRLVREVAAVALGGLDVEQAAGRLVQMTKGKDEVARRNAAELLGSIHAEQAAEHLLELTKDEDASLRASAAQALGRIGAEQSLERLLELLRDRYRYVRELAAEALGGVGGGQAYERLLVLTRHEDGRVREAAAGALGSIGAEQAVERLLELTTDAEPFVRLNAAKALGSVGAERAVGRLIELTRDKNRDVRASAVGALGRIGTPEAVERLLELTKTMYLRWGAVQALSDIGDERAVKRLVELTEVGGGESRGNAARALGRAVRSRELVGVEKCAGLLLQLTTHNDSMARVGAVEALGSLGVKEAVGRLRELLADRQQFVREAAIEALWHIAWKNKLKLKAV